jgi:hypothetical protein
MTPQSIPRARERLDRSPDPSLALAPAARASSPLGNSSRRDGSGILPENAVSTALSRLR